MQEECYRDKCYINKSNLKFVEYQSNVKTGDNKNYVIIYKCRYCKTEFAKCMSDKNDPNPDWLICVDSDKFLNHCRILNHCRKF